jgi:hypothetical protein
MEVRRVEFRISSMETLSNSKVAGVLVLLCAVPICGAAADNTAELAVPGRAYQSAHQSAQARKLLPNIGATNFENSVGRSPVPNYQIPGDKTPANESSAQSESDAVHAAFANLNWQSRSKTVEETGRRFHQEGIPLTHLWQGTSSSVSIGINPDRKPGLWFSKRFP